MNKILLHKNSAGVEIVRIDMKKRSKVCVYGYSDNGERYTIRTYRMNNIPFYEHQYLSWDNLDCCNGWTYDEEYLYTAVQKNKKLISNIMFETTGEDKDKEKAWIKVKDFVHDVDEPKLNAVLEPGHVNYFKNRYWSLTLIKDGCLADYFDLIELRTAYSLQGFDILPWYDELELLFSMQLTDLYKERENFFYNPVSYVDCIIAGLCFGYPIESTVDFMSR
jgi:hypothetical protein